MITTDPVPPPAGAGAPNRDTRSAPAEDHRAAAPARPARPRRRRRWHRVAVPFAVAVLLFTITGVTHTLDQPDPTKPGFLSPERTGPDGGSRLADALRADGVSVQRVTRTPDGLAAAQRAGDVTLFVPAPAKVHPRYLPILTDWAGLGRVVLVDPREPVLSGTRVPLVPTSRRWATRAVDPTTDAEPCVLPEARDAGVAAALRQRYTVGPDYDSPDPPVRCYQDGLVQIHWLDVEIVVIGTSDPFRNDRIGEHRNAELARGLLAGRGQVVWLDINAPEPPPAPVLDRTTGVPNDPYHVQPGDGHLEGDDRSGQDGPGGSGNSGDQEEPDAPVAQPPPEVPENPLWNAFPPWFWALLAQLAVALLLIVLWRARRLGPPVSEPLPVRVTAAETVLGRGRLYQRARARGPVADILRSAALTRLLPAVNLPPDTAEEKVATAVAARTGRTAEAVRGLLYGPEPDTDAELLGLARELDQLTHRTPGPVPHTGPGDRPLEGDDR